MDTLRGGISEVIDRHPVLIIRVRPLGLFSPDSERGRAVIEIADESGRARVEVVDTLVAADPSDPHFNARMVRPTGTYGAGPGLELPTVPAQCRR